MRNVRIHNRFQTALISCNEVSYIEQSRRKITVYTASGSYWEYCSMEAMLMRLDDRIYRCHHSLAVNMDAIRSISRDTIELIDGSTITMCRSATSRAKKAWLDYISR